MDVARERELIKRLRAESYKTREDRLQVVKSGEPGTIIVGGYTVDDLYHLLPGRKIEWVSNTARFTNQPERPLWTESESVINMSPKTLKVDLDGNTITFNDDECQTHTVRISMIFTLTVRVQPPRRTQEVKRVPRHLKRKMNQKKLVV